MNNICHKSKRTLSPISGVWEKTMRNIGIPKVMKWDVEHFTSPFGVKIRRFINPVFRRALKLGTKRKIIVEQYPKLVKKSTYIFSSSHSFDDDVIAALSTIDRSAYFLAGTSEQILYNPQMYAGWINGMVYVNRLDVRSRKDSVEKMVRVLEMGSSILIFPEGGWNNTENLLIQPLFSGPFTLWQRTGCSVVPLASFHEHNAQTIYVRAGKPMTFEGMSKEDALCALRNSMATMMFEMIEAHCTPFVRNRSNDIDYRLRYMEERCREYQRVLWTKDVWDEELAFYHDKNHPIPKKVWEFVDFVSVNTKNARILAPILIRRQEDKKYDFNSYMHKNWDKSNRQKPGDGGIVSH